MSMLGTKKGKILTELLSGRKMITELKSIVPSYDVLRYNLLELQTEGYITKKESRDDKRRYFIDLTDKGRRVAEQLKRAEAISQGRNLPSTERYAVILYLYRNGSKNMKEINEDLPGSTEILRDLEKLKIIRQEINKSNYPQETTLTLTEKGREIGEMLEKVEEKMEE